MNKYIPGEFKQLLFLRSDLDQMPVGALVAQGCHASIAALEEFKDEESTKEYLKELTGMTTIVYKIQESDIEPIIDKLNKFGLKYHIWLENGLVVTCIATIPINKKFCGMFRNKYKLF